MLMEQDVLKSAVPAIASPGYSWTPAPSLGQCDGKPVEINLARLMTTKLLIQAMSGGGKSWALRRILEQTFGMVQQVVIDPEGELVSLATQFDYLVCSPDSEDARITCGTGARTADAIFRSGRSVILSLEEFEIEDMQRFVADFIAQLIGMPKELWHHILIAVDEAQLFAPQHDKAASKKAMIDLAGRGRKRGLCLAAATLRLSQLHKGVAAHLENKLIGLTTLANDVKRAAEQLGMPLGTAQDVLRALDTGEFIAFGAGLSSFDFARVRIGPVVTPHGALGKFQGVAPVPSMSRDELASIIHASSVTPTKPAESVVGEGQSEVHPDIVESITRYPRFVAVQPLLRGPVGTERVAKRAAELGVGVSTLYKWIQVYDDEIGPASLVTERRPNELIANLLRVAGKKQLLASPMILPTA